MQLQVPTIKGLLCNLTNVQYNTLKELISQLIVNIGFYQMWYYNVPDQGRIWTIILRIANATIPAIVQNPAPGIAGPRHVRLGMYHLFLVCQKYLISNNRAMWDKYIHEYDHYVLASYDAFTYHHRGVYAENLAWAANNPGNPMGGPLPQFPTLFAPPPIPVPLGLGAPIRCERGPPQINIPPPILFLPTSFAYWVNRYPGPSLPPNMPLPPTSWKTAAHRRPVANIPALLAALPPYGSLNPTLPN